MQAEEGFASFYATHHAGIWAYLVRLGAPHALASDLAQDTFVRCAWTETALQVRFECVDTEPWATITQRDGPLWEEEVVEVFLDPVGDLESYFEFEVNPLGTVLDLVLRRNRSGYRKDFAWNCKGLRTQVQRTAQGWDAEFAIPFASLVPETPRAGTPHERRWNDGAPCPSAVQGAC